MFTFLIQTIIGIGQSSSSSDLPFFKKQVVEFQKWIENSQIGFLKVSNVTIQDNGKLSINLSTTNQDPDSLYSIWLNTKRGFEREDIVQFEERLLKVSSFLCDSEMEKTNILISNHSGTFQISIEYLDGRINVQEDIERKMVSELIKIDLSDLNIPKSILKDTIRNNSIRAVRGNLSDFLIDYYKDKGTFFYEARIDTSYTFWNEFSYIVTCLSNEIIHEGFFEFIRLDVVLSQSEKNLEILLEIQGKYAAALVCPEKRKSFYKSMDIHYSESLRRYASFMKNKFIQHLSNNR